MGVAIPGKLMVICSCASAKNTHRTVANLKKVLGIELVKSIYNCIEDGNPHLTLSLIS